MVGLRIFMLLGAVLVLWAASLGNSTEAIWAAALALFAAYLDVRRAKREKAKCARHAPATRTTMSRQHPGR
jgi:hypothetical protein